MLRLSPSPPPWRSPNLLTSPSSSLASPPLRAPTGNPQMKKQENKAKQTVNSPFSELICHFPMRRTTWLLRWPPPTPTPSSSSTALAQCSCHGPHRSRLSCSDSSLDKKLVRPFPFPLPLHFSSFCLFILISHKRKCYCQRVVRRREPLREAPHLLPRQRERLVQRRRQPVPRRQHHHLISSPLLFFSFPSSTFVFSFFSLFFLILFKYSEKLLVGYRWYDNQNIVPLWPFGHGLSYTTFLYSNLQIDGDVSPSLPPSLLLLSLPPSLSSFYSFLFIVLIRSPQLCMSRWAYRTQEPFSALRLFRCTFSSPPRPASHQRYADKERGERGRERGKEDINIECIGVAWVRQIRHRTLFHSRGLLQLGPRINLYLGYPLCFLSPSLHPLPPFCFILLSHLLFLWTEKISPPAPGRLCRGPSRYWLARPQETFACKPPSPHRYLLPSLPLLSSCFPFLLF